MKKKAENIRLITKFFTGDDSFLPINLAQLCLQFSGNLRITKKALCYVTFRIPAFRGTLFKPIQVSNFRKGENALVQQNSFLI